MIKHEGGKYCLYTKDGTKKLGEHDTEAEALAQERAIEASKHRAAEQPRYLTLVNATGAVRREPYNGREYVVVPVVALVEGVIHAVNAPHPELVRASEFTDCADWEGMPVHAGHPMKDNVPISGRLPDILPLAIGVVRNPKVDHTRLLMEAWIDPSRCGEGAGARILGNVTAVPPKMVEVSVGVFTTTAPSTGVWNGKRYAAEWRGMRKDHLALLDEGKRGACSIEMGCGTPRVAMRVAADGTLETLGDVEGHEFHGNQWTSGGGGKDDEFLSSPSDAVATLAGGERATVAAEDVRSVVEKAAKNPATIDLTNLSIEGTELFHGGTNIPRDEMPQIPRTAHKEMLADLKGQGISSREQSVKPMSLLPTQNGINAGHVGGIVKAVESGKKDFTPSLVSSDNYVLDGHHHWAAAVVMQIDKPSVRMPIVRINLPRDKAVKTLNAYADAHGFKRKTITDLQESLMMRSFGARVLEFFRSAMPRGWGDDEVKEELRDALLVVEPAFKSGEIVRVKNDEVIYCLYPPPQQYYEQTMQPMTYWSRSYTFDTTTQKYSVSPERTQVEPSTVYLPYRERIAESVPDMPEPTPTPCACGNHAAAAAGESVMNKGERIAALVANPHSPVKDIKVLEGLTDEGLTALETTAGTLKVAAEKATADAAALKVAQDAEQAAKDALAKAQTPPPAPKPQTADEFLASPAGAPLKALVDAHNARLATEKDAVVQTLKAATAGSFTEEELKAKPIEELQKLAMLVKATVPTPVDFSFQGTPRAATVAPGDVSAFIPPDPYAKDLAAK